MDFRLDCPNPTEIDVANHLNGKIEGTCDSPMFSLNAIYNKTQYVDVALVQCFFGQDTLQENAIELALKFMSMSNPRPREWVFVEAQRREMDAKFKWVVGLGCKYVFVKIQSDKQDHFIKEQLWNIGAKNTKSRRLVFVDSDVAYCQMDWLSHVKETFDEGVELFQPHSWSWRANESNSKDEIQKKTDLGIMESFASRRKHDKPLQCFNGHTGYDIAISRRHYNNIRGFWSVWGTGGDFLNWTILTQGPFLSDNPMGIAAKEILKIHEVEIKPIGCSELVCFHNFHGDHSHRESKYARDLSIAQSGSLGYANNYGKNCIVEIGGNGK